MIRTAKNVVTFHVYTDKMLSIPCPVCRAEGTVLDSSLGYPRQVRCRHCNGKGSGIVAPTTNKFLLEND